MMKIPRGEPDVLDQAAAPAVEQRGCPCGCLTKLPYFDDPDCIRHQPMPKPGDRPFYDMHDLGLAPHDRATCEHCRGAA